MTLPILPNLSLATLDPVAQAVDASPPPIAARARARHRARDVVST